MICKCCGRDLPEDQFKKNKLGVSHVCKECIRQKSLETRENKKKVLQLEKTSHTLRNLRLADFQPVELMKELKRRGYKFTMNYTKVEVINSDDID